MIPNEEYERNIFPPLHGGYEAGKLQRVLHVPIYYVATWLGAAGHIFCMAAGPILVQYVASQDGWHHWETD